MCGMVALECNRSGPANILILILFELQLAVSPYKYN